MVGNPSKPPFLFLFVIGLLTVVALSALTLVLVIAWRYFRGRRGRTQSSIAAFALPTIVEEGRSTPNALDFSCRGPSRLGGISPMSAEGTGPRLEPTVQRGGMDDSSLVDVKRLDFSPSQNSTHAITTSTAERVQQVEPEGHAQTTKSSSVPLDLGNSGDMAVEQGRSQSFTLPTPPKDPPFPPPAPRTPGGRLSMSTVWSQESMWPREIKFPMPPLAYLPVPQRVRSSPLMVSGPPSPRSMSSFPRSVAPSDFGDDYY